MSNFLGALLKVKESTKRLAENASTQISLRLQMELASMNQSPLNVSNVSFKNSPFKSEKCVSEINTQNKFIESSNCNDVIISEIDPTIQPSLKYSDPISIVTTTLSSNITQSDVKDFMISKSTEFVNNNKSNFVSTLAEISVPNSLCSSVCCDNNLVLSQSNMVDSATKDTCLPVNDPIAISSISSQVPYSFSCNSDSCNLPSCQTESATAAFQPNIDLDFKDISVLQNNQNISIESPEPPLLVAENSSASNSSTSFNQAIVENTINNLVSPIKILESPKLDLPLTHNIYPVFNPKKFCIFCKTKEHNSHNCCLFNQNSKFWNVVYKEKRCKNCLRQFHNARNCFDSNFCLFSRCRRRDKHSPILCKWRYEKFQRFSLNENYQDILRGSVNNYCNLGKSFYSQGCQTENLGTQSVETQTSNLFLNENVESSAKGNSYNTLSNYKTNSCKPKRENLLNFSTKFISNSDSSFNFYISSSNSPNNAKLSLPISTSNKLSLSACNSYSTYTVSSVSCPITSTISSLNSVNTVTGTESNIGPLKPFSSNVSTRYDPDEISRLYYAEWIKTRQISNNN